MGDAHLFNVQRGGPEMFSHNSEKNVIVKYYKGRGYNLFIFGKNVIVKYFKGRGYNLFVLGKNYIVKYFKGRESF